MQPTMKADGGLIMKHDNDYTIGLKNVWEVVCYGSDGAEKWRELNKNLVTTAGANHVLDGTFKSGTQITSWFVGLKAAGTPVIADTMASHASWTELVHTTTYSQTVRQTLTLGSITGNNATSSVTAGTLYGVVDFGSARAVISGDTLEVTVTITAASA